jgi:plastocyanin
MSEHRVFRRPASWRPALALTAAVLAIIVSAVPAQAVTVDISIAGFAFSPPSAPMQLAGGEPGYTSPHVHVVWTMNDPGTEHTVTFDDPRLVSSEHLVTGQRYEVVLYTPGTFTYRCTIHPKMTGALVVSPAAAEPTTSPAPAGPSAQGSAALAPSSTSSGPGPWLLLVGIAVAAGTAGAGLALLGRRRRPRPSEPDDR